MDAIFTIGYGWGGVGCELVSKRHRQDDAADNEDDSDHATRNTN